MSSSLSMQVQIKFKVTVLALSLLTLGSMRGQEAPANLCEQRTASESEFTLLTYNAKGLPWPVATGRNEPLQHIAKGLHIYAGNADAPTLSF